MPKGERRLKYVPGRASCRLFRDDRGKPFCTQIASFKSHHLTQRLRLPTSTLHTTSCLSEHRSGRRRSLAGDSRPISLDGKKPSLKQVRRLRHRYLSLPQSHLRAADSARLRTSWATLKRHHLPPLRRPSPRVQSHCNLSRVGMRRLEVIRQLLCRQKSIRSWTCSPT